MITFFINLVVMFLDEAVGLLVQRHRLDHFIVRRILLSGVGWI